VKGGDLRPDPQVRVQSSGRPSRKNREPMKAINHVALQHFSIMARKKGYSKTKKVVYFHLNYIALANSIFTDVAQPFLLILETFS